MRMAAGLALSDTGKRVVTLCGDSAFLHSGFNALVDAVRADVHMLLVILDNGTTALSGRQPHPASDIDPRGRPRPSVDLVALAKAAGVKRVDEVDLDGGDNIREAIDVGLATGSGGVSVLIARGRCVLD